MVSEITYRQGLGFGAMRSPSREREEEDRLSIRGTVKRHRGVKKWKERSRHEFRGGTREQAREAGLHKTSSQIRQRWDQ